MLNVQELVGGVLTSVAGSVMNRIPTLYMAIGATVLLLVGTYFVYKWFFSAPEKPATTESFVEPIKQRPSPHVSFAPHIEVSEIPSTEGQGQEQEQEYVQDQDQGQEQEQEQEQEHMEMRG